MQRLRNSAAEQNMGSGPNALRFNVPDRPRLMSVDQTSIYSSPIQEITATTFGLLPHIGDVVHENFVAAASTTGKLK